MQHVNLVGYLVADMTQKQIPSGNTVWEFTIVGDMGKNSEKKIWYRISSFQDMSSRTDYMLKGCKIFVAGKVRDYYAKDEKNLNINIQSTFTSILIKPEISRDMPKCASIHTAHVTEKISENFSDDFMTGSANRYQ